jgi:transcription-repair coupling factor (superfamily II helicase)
MGDGFLQHLPRLASPGCRLSGLNPGAALWAVARMVSGARKSDRRLPLLVVLPTPAEAERWATELPHYLGPAVPVELLPADDVRPWDGMSPHPDIPRQRLVVLDLLERGVEAVIIAPARALQLRVLPPSVIRKLRIHIEVGQDLDRDALIASLVDLGYLVLPLAQDPGTLSWRGDVIDIWPPGQSAPIRISLFDTEVESIRRVEPGARTSLGELSELTLLPAREAVVTEAALKRASAQTMKAVDAMGGGQQTRRAVLRELREGLWFPGAEDYLSALHPVVDPLSYIRRGRGVVVVEPEAVHAELERFSGVVSHRWNSLDPDERPPVLPETRYLDSEEVWSTLQSAIQLGELLVPGVDEEVVELGCRDNGVLRAGKRELAPVVSRLREWMDEGSQLALAVDSRARSERVRSLLAPHGLDMIERTTGEHGPPGSLSLWIAPLSLGFHCPSSGIAVVSADEIFAAKQRRKRVPKSLKDAVVSSLNQLKAGDYVVHSRHGVGRFEGLQRVQTPTADGVLEQDFALILYRGDDRMYLPVSRLDQLYRYRAIGEREPRLDKLGGLSWAKRKSKVRDRVAAMAESLLRLHAMRAVVEGHAYQGSPPACTQFAETFPFVETPDQEQVIAEVLEDMAGSEPMDRLVVGDVGFGKTEVAMRAAMRVVAEGRQVAVLCPTTVLAFQHQQSFIERFREQDLTIELLSRFRSASEQRRVLDGLRDGTVDMVIGTHALFGRNTRFSNLGLLIIDEEHRFGVKQKEKLKKLAQTWSAVPCEVLSMSATPIPRTLHMAMSGIRDVSLIATPPQGRRAVQTKVMRWSESRIREDILHELRRGGQVFFVHNRVQTIHSVAKKLRDLVPEARFAVAHGQMAEGELESVLVDFVQRKHHVLVCSTIIESGVDMPNVNTMLVNRADQLGLAQLYQLRGRVGRSHRRGYCTLIIPGDAALAKKAMRRMRVLQDHTELGSGFAIASADLEMRGGGDLLGAQQHGHIEAVGFDTYVELLEAAVQAARGDIGRTQLDPEIEVPVSALIPDDYMPDMDDRLQAYRALASCREVSEIRRLLADWEGSWGEPPRPVLNLGWQAEIRALARDLGIERVHWLSLRAHLDFHPTTRVEPEQIVDLLRDQPQRFSMNSDKGGRRLVVRCTPEEAEHPFQFLHWALRQLR